MSTAPDLSPYRPTFAEVDLDAFRRNVRAIKSSLPPTSRLIAVLKANAYGHGALELARICEEEDAEMIAVALFEEAVELQDAGIDLPILILGALHAAQVEEAVRRRFVLGVASPEALALVCDYSEEHRVDVAVHLKLDSGMGRMGLLASDLDDCVAMLRAHPHVRVDALYTHFANASDPRDSFTNEQLRNFHAMTRTLEEAGISAPLHHVANSAATVRGLVRDGEYARVGIALYGGEALDVGTTRLEPVLTWRTKIVRLKSIPPGAAVGYGTTFKASRESLIATVPVGYADGYDRLLSNRGVVLIRGQRAPVVGRVSMDLVTIDVTDIPGAAVGDTVTLIGRDGGEEVNAEEVAALIGTINYEVFCAISARVPRLYRAGGAVVALRSRFAAASA